MNWFRTILLLAFPLALITCHSSQRAVKANLYYQYENDPTILHPDYVVFNQNQDVTSLYVQIDAAELLYSKNNRELKFLSQMILQVHVFEADNINKIIASDTIFLFDQGGHEEGKFLTGMVELDLPYGQNYMAEVTFDDQYRLQYVQDVVYINKKDDISEQNFLVKNEKDEVQFSKSFPEGTKLKIEKNGSLGADITMDYYVMHESLPAPPFAQENLSGINFESDSSSEILVNNGRNFEIELDRRGMYHFRPNIGSRLGLTILSMEQHFPEIKTVKSMLAPMRYITTRQEFNELKDAEDLKKRIDAFWFGIAGNAERAKEVINMYYSRVEFADKIFTSHMAGWKSDRGLIYIIYGTPNSVYKKRDYETWTYNEKNNIMSVDFTFYKVENPFSDNDFYLSRSVGYKSSWYRAIDSWRQGRIF